MPWWHRLINLVPLPNDSRWMNTMFRCALVTLCVAASIAPAAAQVQRNFPQNALRGNVEFTDPPDITLNRKTARLAPGVRIRGLDNMLQMSGALAGQRATVNYTVEDGGLINNIWILRPEELAMKPWPTTMDQAQAWTFDPVAQTWTKP